MRNGIVKKTHIKGSEGDLVEIDMERPENQSVNRIDRQTMSKLENLDILNDPDSIQADLLESMSADNYSRIFKSGKASYLDVLRRDMRSPKLLPLALLALNEEEQIEGITRFQKLVFMAQNEIPDLQTGEYTFKSYSYGPFSKELYDDIDKLVTNGYIERTVEQTGNGNEKHIYSLTKKGREYIRQILETESGSEDLEVESLRQLKDEYNDMPILQLIRLVYNKHPEYAEDSKLEV